MEVFILPTVKIHIPSTVLISERPTLVKEAMKLLDESSKKYAVLQAAEKNSGDCWQVILYDALPQHRGSHSAISDSFAFIEILLPQGMSPTDKKQLMGDICAMVAKYTKLPLPAVSCCTFEYGEENWYSA